MPDKYKALKDALADDSLTLHHIAVAEDGICRFMTGRKLPPHLDSMELHGIDSGRGVRDSVAVPKATIRDLLADRDRLLQACETALSYVEAVCFNTPNDKKRRNYADCAAKIRAAMGEDEGEQDES